MQSHKAVIFNGAMTSQLHKQGPDDVVVSALPRPRVCANVLMTGMLMFGTKLVLHKLFDRPFSCRISPSTRRWSSTAFLQYICLS